MSLMEISCIFPVTDIKKTACFYVSKLGYKAVEYLECKEAHICLYRDKTEIILLQAQTKNIFPNRELYGYGYDAYLYTDDQEKLEKEFLEKGVKIVKPLNHIYTRNSIGCKCGVKNSYISKMIFYTLMDLKVEFDTEVEFEWCEFYNKYKNKDSYGRYDFVIKNLKIIIEADGGFHREDNLMNGQTKEESQYIDDMKDRLAEEHGYKVIRIDDVGNVQQNILNSKLNEVLNLEKVNWGEIQLNATSNKVKTVCEMYEEGYSCLELAKLTKLSRASICKYLRKGNEMGWCNYDGKTNSKYNSVPNGGYVVLKDGDFVEHFLSLKDMKQYFKDNKNMAIRTRIISSELKSGIETFNYKEYDFMYFDNYNLTN